MIKQWDELSPEQQKTIGQAIVGTALISFMVYGIWNMIEPSQKQLASSSSSSSAKALSKPKDYQQTKTTPDGVSYQFTRTLHADAIVDCIEVRSPGKDVKGKPPYLACSIWRNPNGESE